MPSAGEAGPARRLHLLFIDPASGRCRLVPLAGRMGETSADEPTLPVDDLSADLDLHGVPAGAGETGVPGQQCTLQCLGDGHVGGVVGVESVAETEYAPSQGVAEALECALLTRDARLA